jgi:hypothetical protein
MTSQQAQQHLDAPCERQSRSTPTPTILRKEARRRGEPFKQVLNNAVLAGLRNLNQQCQAFEAFIEMGKPRVELTKVAPLASELEDDELLGRYRRR